MKNKESSARIAIVGFGPRGLGALEALVTLAMEEHTKLSVDLFDPLKSSGAGPNYDPGQSELCILNIPLRSLNIDPPAFLADKVGPFDAWSSTSYAPEDFPPRSDIGAYFHARFKTLCEAAKDISDITHKKIQITGMERTENDWWLTTKENRYGPYNEVLLTQGQPKTAPDPQLKRWSDHARKNSLELLPAYPANSLIDAAKHWSDKTVAIRGLGLSTFDVLRMLTSGLGGTFEGESYIHSGNEPHRILPFSLDGRPPAPKPANVDIDRCYDPIKNETRQYQRALTTAFSTSSTDALTILCEALIAPASRILKELDGNDLEADVRVWLEFERAHAGAQEYLGARDTLEAGIAMSHGRAAPSAGYTISQVWRKWEGLTRSAFNDERLDSKTSSAIVEFDESLKRYSAGPPVSSSEELLALVNNGVVSLCTVDDPSILLSERGWRLMEGDDALTASVMIDAVLPSPNVQKVTDPLVRSALAEGMIQQLSLGRGLISADDGQLFNSAGKLQHGLSALGRLALGSVMAVDSLHDCFGETSAKWAVGVLDRVSKRTAQESSGKV